MKKINPIDNFQLEKKDLLFTGSDLHRPECILATRDLFPNT